MDRLHVQEERLMHRFYADPARSSDEIAFLTPEDSHHALDVLRLKAGDHAEIILNGLRMEGEICLSGDRDLSVRIVSMLPSTEPALQVTLFQGLPKADKMDLIVQKATELGVSRIVPVFMSRCVVKLDPKDLNRKLERWNRIAREAGKQSGRCVIPVIAEPVRLNRLPYYIPLPEINAVPWEEASGFGPLAFRNKYPVLSSLGILIGPEGGIEKNEIQVLESAGFIPVTLGKRILRTETAGLAAISSFMSLYGEME